MPKKLGTIINFGTKKNWIRKFWVRKYYAKKIGNEKKFGCKKNWVRTKFGYETFWYEKKCVRKCWVRIQIWVLIFV